MLSVSQLSPRSTHNGHPGVALSCALGRRTAAALVQGQACGRERARRGAPCIPAVSPPMWFQAQAPLTAGDRVRACGRQGVWVAAVLTRQGPEGEWECVCEDGSSLRGLAAHQIRPEPAYPDVQPQMGATLTDPWSGRPDYCAPANAPAHVANYLARLRGAAARQLWWRVGLPLGRPAFHHG